MTLFAIGIAAWVAVSTVWALMSSARLRGIEREISQLKAGRPSIRGAVKITRQLRDGLIDIDLRG